MKKILIQTGRPCEILLEMGLLGHSGQILSARNFLGKIAIISDHRVWSLHGNALTASLQSAGFQGLPFVFQAGEESKNLETVARIVNFLAENSFTRSDFIVALGGGVTGDIAGFCAAIYLRGIRYIQIPTTFLAAVDSSVGGKTGVDLPTGKNLIGAFWQPDLVLCDPAVLKTLPVSIFNEGVAEGIKYGVIGDANLFECLAAGRLHQELEAVIYRCIQIKGEIVRSDERDTGQRQLLNFGHTIGHGVELCSNFQIRHGEAVAIGMVQMSRIAWKMGWAKENIEPALRQILEQFQLPTDADFPPESLCNAILSDKKRRGDSITLVIPERIGAGKLVKVSVSQIPSLLAL